MGSSPDSAAGTASREESIVCFCHGITDAEIRQAIANGAKSLIDIKNATRASTGCGGCTCECERILAEMLEQFKS